MNQEAYKKKIIVPLVTLDNHGLKIAISRNIDQKVVFTKVKMKFRMKKIMIKKYWKLTQGLNNFNKRKGNLTLNLNLLIMKLPLNLILL